MHYVGKERHATVTPVAIHGFFGDYRFLSNFHIASVAMDDGIVYPTSEHAYMAQKTLDLDIRKRLAAIKAPFKVRCEGQAIELRADWDAYKSTAMLKVQRAKFGQHVDLADRLLATGSLYLEETNDWKDVYWGVCEGRGLNMLGKTLMQVRLELYYLWQSTEQRLLI